MKAETLGEEIDDGIGAGYRRQRLGPSLAQLGVPCSDIWLQHLLHGLNQARTIPARDEKPARTVFGYEARPASQRIGGDDGAANAHRLSQHLGKALLV